MIVDPYTGELVLVVARNPFTYDMQFASDESGLFCDDPSRAVQSALEETDINTIVRRFHLTGQLPTDVRPPVYGDFTEVGDFKSALNAVIAAEASFMQMPAEVRARFQNDAGLFVDFCSDAGNRDEMKKLGLLVPEKAPVEPVQVRVVADPPPKV